MWTGISWQLLGDPHAAHSRCGPELVSSVKQWQIVCSGLCATMKHMHVYYLQLCVYIHICILMYVSRCMQTFYLVLLSFYSWEFNTLVFLKTLLVWCQFYQVTKKMSRYFLQRLKGCSWKSSKYVSKTTPKLHFAVENNICMHKSGQSHSLKKKQTSLTIWQVTATWDTTKIQCFTESSLHIAVDWLG